ncbi:hypothetical protein I4U23_019750 [Adineta vaga]|nr:hypothetical protein I4U23_019750 [Adineta vaga]
MYFRVQVYNTDGEVLSHILTCDNKDDITDNMNFGYRWNELELLCSEDNAKVHEEQIIEQVHDGDDSEWFPDDVQASLDKSEKLYGLKVDKVEEEDSTANVEYKMIFNGQAANDKYFTKYDKTQRKRIFISFRNHGVICQIEILSERSNPCPTNDPTDIHSQYSCYYNPGGKQPTRQEMAAEFRQIEKAVKPDGKEAYVLNLKRPNLDASESSNSDGSDDDDVSSGETNSGTASNRGSNSSNKNGGPKSPGKNTGGPPSPAAKRKTNPLKIFGIVVGILLLLSVIGGIGFYMFRQHRLKMSISTSSSNLGDGYNKHSSTLGPSESQQSISTNDKNTEISTNNPSHRGKPTVELQTHDTNKRQRTGASMVFNEDM